MRFDAFRRIAGGALALLFLVAWGGTEGFARAAPLDVDLALEYQVKAVFLYHFTRYLQWPEGEEAEVFEIAVLGDSPILEPLREIERKRTVGPLPLVVRSCKTAEEVGNPRIVFIAGPVARRSPEVLAAMRGKGVLTVTEGEGLADQGAAINFVLREGTVKFEINEQVLREEGISAGSQMLKLAIRVGQGARKAKW